MMNERHCADIKAFHGLSGLHIFDTDRGWVVFGFRRNAEGFQASAESGHGETIQQALSDLNNRLHEGPVHKKGGP